MYITPCTLHYNFINKFHQVISPSLMSLFTKRILWFIILYSILIVLRSYSSINELKVHGLIYYELIGGR